MQKTLSCVALLVPLAGCYTYQPLAAPEPEVGTRVSVQLTETGSRQLWSQIGHDILHLEGDVMEADSTAIRLSVRQAENARGIPTNWNGERVAVPRVMILGMQQRRLSIGGTVFMGGVMTAALLALYRVVDGGSLSGNPGTGNPGPQQ